MAGEFEEPYSISFQTDSLHSGSISFGRFESEDLPWERRSSFSHNKYLEEVEKCSKPGSVIEKKAYFEAHFKKKGMRLPGSFGSQNGRECHGENDSFENVSPKEGEDDNMNASSHYTQFDDGVLENADYAEFDDGYAGGQFDHTNSSTQYAHFDENHEGSEDCGECEGMECERENPNVLSSESRMEAALDNANVLLEGVLENIKSQDAYQTYTGSHSNDRQKTGTKEKLNDNGTSVDEISMPISPSLRSGTGGIKKITAVHLQNHSPKLGAPTESKCIEPRMKSPVITSQVQKFNSNDRSKTAMKKQNRRERESPQRRKLEKQSPQAAIPTRRTLLGTPKGKDSESFNSRLNLANKSASEKEPKVKKVVESQPSGSKKDEPRVRQSPNRLKQTISSAKPEASTGTPVFSFRSDERAERRREFYMKLEEKMHAKEAEMNQIQAKTQEKTQAEIKQFRKSLNFKATPMPSFYHDAASPGSSGNKVTSSKSKPAKIQHKSTSPGNGAATRSQLLYKAGNNHVGELVKTISPPESLGTVDCHSTEPSEAGETLPKNSSSNAEAVMKNGVTGKKSEKVTTPQRRRVSENGRVSKDHRVESKPKMGNRRNSSDLVRKSMKGVGIGSNSGMGRVAVGVAS